MSNSKGTAALLSLALCTGAVSATSSKAPNPCGAEAVERNKAVVRVVFEEILSQGRIDENEGIYHPDFVAHGPKRDSGRKEDRAASQGWRQAVPDLEMKVLRTVGECDFVAVHWAGSGTNSGAGNGLPATGKTVSNLWGMTIFRLEEGKIREEWTSFDQYPMLEQLGLLGK